MSYLWNHEILECTKSTREPRKKRNKIADLISVRVLLEYCICQPLVILEQRRDITNRKFAGIRGIDKTLNWWFNFRRTGTTRRARCLRWWWHLGPLWQSWWRLSTAWTVRATAAKVSDHAWDMIEWVKGIAKASHGAQGR